MRQTTPYVNEQRRQQQGMSEASGTWGRREDRELSPAIQEGHGAERDSDEMNAKSRWTKLDFRSSTERGRGRREGVDP